MDNMNDKQNGVVDWIFNQLPYEYKTTRSGFDVYQQAKVMFKDEMIDFGNDLLAQNDTNYIGIPNLAEQYYLQTYGDDKR